jgi:hypothetical protein
VSSAARPNPPLNKLLEVSVLHQRGALNPIVAIARATRMRMKYRRFESEAARLFGAKILREQLHTKNVVEASVLCSACCARKICGGSR